MLSSNLLKSKKIPMSGGVGWNQFSTFDAESKFALKKKVFGQKLEQFCFGL